MCHLRAQAALPLTIVALLVAMSLACNATANPPAAPRPSATATLEAVTDSTQLTTIVRDIVKNPRNYEGKPVTIVGYYRGWDLLHEANTAPPVTRSDWVVKDASGGIYCVPAPGGAETVGSFRLNPASKADTDKVLRLTGAVRTKDGRPYIEYTRIELVR